MRAVHLVSALAASCLATEAFAWDGAGSACASGYHPDPTGSCQPNIAETNRFCPAGAVYHPWINGGWYCEYPDQPASRATAAYPERTHERPAPRRREHRYAPRRTSAPAVRTDEARSIPAPTDAPVVPINPGFSAPPVIHSSGGGGGGGGGGWSDRRLKRDIVRLGLSRGGLPIYAFQYVWGGPRYIGVMAQDLLRLRPDAVILDESGYYKVDYSRIDVEMREEPLAA